LRLLKKLYNRLQSITIDDYDYTMSDVHGILA